MVVTHGSYEITATRAGRDHTVRCGAGTILLVSGDERPHIRRIRGEADVVATHLTPEWLRYAAIDPRELRGREPVAGSETARVLAASMRAEVEDGCAKGRLYAESLSLALLSFTYGLLPDARAPGHGRLRGDTRRRLEQYMREHLQHNLTLRELAERVGLQPRQFSHCFRETFGTSPHRYLTELRLQAAASLLRCGAREIAEVALSVGFCSQSHFTTAFRRRFGVTPRQHMRRTIHPFTS